MDLSKRHFKLPDNVSSMGIGEPVITADKDRYKGSCFSAHFLL